jgi:hypothetical protein
MTSRSVNTYDWVMAYDEDLANQIRRLIGHDRALTEQKLFGGLAFLIQPAPAN